ncbi:alpha/beta hydrolase [Piscinibacter sp. HJYY11]|uniref:alpha/beta hydrolase n=1 Tax=Piscinibacter sp. HJYY11 TaxID=2801333 RepID=UPI00191F543A|nr:alpha/beta hydrolase [Piscinibacter sp. HJYY11]MBL0726669.1 alpha/beta hydrolase [Piscinibacter sp. HJYY11]
MRSLLERIHRAGVPPLHSMPVRDARKAYTLRSEVLDLPRAPLARVEDITIPAADGTPLEARLYAPSTAVLPLMLYTHGGGFTIGNLETHDSLCRQFALRSGVAVVALHYRLAPEHRFPVAVDDTWSAMTWLSRHGATLGLDGTRLAVGGDSAGGTLAAVAALHARDIGLPLALQLLITPGTTAHQDTASHEQFESGFLLEGEGIDWFFNHYIDRAHREDWRFAPLNADDAEGVAPACFILAECDPLVDEGIAYADKLRAAGVAVDLDLYRGVTHDFIKMGRALPEAIAALDAASLALQKALTP